MTIEYPEKLFFDGPISTLNDLTNLSFSYGLIEELITGGSFLKYIDEKFILHFEKNEYHLLSHRPRKTKRITSSKYKKPVNYIYQSWINPFTFKCNRVNLIFPENNSQINVVYKNREEIDGYSSPKDIEMSINNIPGVLENGLFVDLTAKVLVGKIEKGIPVVYSLSKVG